MSILVPEWSRARVYCRSFAGNMDSNPDRGMAVCLLWVCCSHVDVSASGRFPVQRSPFRLWLCSQKCSGPGPLWAVVPKGKNDWNNEPKKFRVLICSLLVYHVINIFGFSILHFCAHPVLFLPLNYIFLLLICISVWSHIFGHLFGPSVMFYLFGTILPYYLLSVYII